MRTALFWAFTQQVVLIPYWRFETTYRSNFQGSGIDSWPLKMEPIGCPETSVANYHYLLCNNPEERISHLFCIRSLNSRRVCDFFYKCLWFYSTGFNKFYLKDLFKTWNCGSVRPSLGTDGRTDGQTDGRTGRRTNRYDEANGGLSPFCKRF
jgi:hypothetical protein